jgi:uncharacterized membrane protein YoaK (UPF0700 family)
VAVLGIVVGLLFLFAPIQRQPIWPLPSLAVAVWSVAPLIGYVGVRRKMAGEASGTALVILALVLEASVLISFGAAPFFVPFVLLPLVISTALALSARVDQRST